jgi:sortase A
VRALRAVIGGAGELCITVGALLLLFVVWQLGYVAVVGGSKQGDVVSALERDFGGAGHGVVQPSQTTAGRPAPPLEAKALSDGDVFGIVRIPRLGGPTWAKPVYQGVGLPVLAKGLGHYTDTQLPGEVGNVAIAGHRAGHGNPLIDIDAIQPGDVMVIETREAYFVYRAVRHEIVDLTKVDVIDPVPEQPGATPTERWFTLTSCNPRYGSSHRYIVFAKFEQKIPHDQGLPADLLADSAQEA